jgi:glycosyltransferase involved in cell wall biosynthesis
MNVAVFFMGIGDVSGGGGAERFFADFFTDYNKDKTKHNLFLLTDKESVKQFNKIDKVTNSKNVLLFKIWSNRFKNTLESFFLSKLIARNKIKIILIPLYNIHYYPLIERINKMPLSVRPKIVPVIVDYNISYYYFDETKKIYNFKKTFEDLFNTIKVDAVITWYQSFKDFCSKNNIIKSNPKIHTVTSRYSPEFKTIPFNEKQNHIVWAGRLTETKRPLMFLEAINLIKDKSGDWKFFIYGKGPLETEVRNYIEKNNLSQRVTLSSHKNPKEVFVSTKCFVSTQDFENFPSLALNEAMVAGNAIIARNVGQTDLFVRDNQNGFLLKEDSAQGLANRILEYISLSEVEKQAMYSSSIELTKTVHTYQNFKSQMESIWEEILNVT